MKTQWKRSRLIKKLKSVSIQGDDAFFKHSEDWNGSKGYIWTGGEGDPSMKVNGFEFGMFSYWTGVTGGFPYDKNSVYDDFGTLKEVTKILDEADWHSEWYDGGTMMIYPN